MKKRNGFVSNSSSSSFVVAVDKDCEKIKIEIELDLSVYGETISTLEELADCYLEYYKTFEELKKRNEYQYKEYIQCKKAIELGKVVIAGCFSSEGKAAEAFLCDYGLPKDLPNVEVIQSEAE